MMHSIISIVVSVGLGLSLTHCRSSEPQPVKTAKKEVASSNSEKVENAEAEDSNENDAASNVAIKPTINSESPDPNANNNGNGSTTATAKVIPFATNCMKVGWEFFTNISTARFGCKKKTAGASDYNAQLSQLQAVYDQFRCLSPLEFYAGQSNKFATDGYAEVSCTMASFIPI